MQTIMENEIFEQPEVIIKSFKKNIGKIRELATMIKKKNIKFIYIVARGTSDNVAIFAKYAFESILGLPVVLAASSVITRYKKSLILNDAIVIGISQSGKGEDILQVMQDAQRNKSLLVSITNDINSPIANISEYSMDCCAGTEKSVAATKTFTSELFLILCLVLSLCDKHDMDEISDNISKSMRQVLANKDIIYEYTKRYRFLEECFVLSRGYNYCVALEGALKMQECAYVRAKAFSTSDFMHGPIAMVEKNKSCILIMNKSKFSDEMKSVIKNVKDYGADLTIISDDSGLLKHANVPIDIARINNDLFSPIIYSVVLQLFSCGLALTKELNPDRPRNLKKVTITI